MTPPLRLATRGSRLALAQAELAARALSAAGIEATELVTVKSQGDIRQSVPATELTGQGWFTAEVEQAIADGRADVAVHSAKDLPSELTRGMELSALLSRADVRDALVSREGVSLAELPAGSRVGTSSPRRVAAIAELNPGVVTEPLRGNVDSRLRKVEAGELDAIVVACAGLDRLGLGDRITERLDPRVVVPAPAQAVVALEAVAGSGSARRVAPADDAQARRCLRAERAVLVALGGGCLIPLGAWAREEEGSLVLVAALAHDGGIRRVELGGAMDDPEGLGERAANALR